MWEDMRAEWDGFFTASATFTKSAYTQDDQGAVVVGAGASATYACLYDQLQEPSPTTTDGALATVKRWSIGFLAPPGDGFIAGLAAGDKAVFGGHLATVSGTKNSCVAQMPYWEVYCEEVI